MPEVGVFGVVLTVNSTVNSAAKLCILRGIALSYSCRVGSVPFHPLSILDADRR